MKATTIHKIRAEVCSAVEDVGEASARIRVIDLNPRGVMGLNASEKRQYRRVAAGSFLRAAAKLTKAAKLAYCEE